MNKICFTDEQIIERWEEYCKRHGLGYVKPNMPLSRNDDWDGVRLMTGKGWLATFYRNTFVTNDTLLKTTEQRIDEIVYLLTEAQEKLEGLLIENEEILPFKDELGELVIRTGLALESAGLLPSNNQTTSIDTFQYVPDVYHCDSKYSFEIIVIQNTIIMANVLSQLRNLLSKVEDVGNTMRHEAAVYRAELEERKRLGLTGEAAVNHYNDYMDKFGMSYLKVQ